MATVQITIPDALIPRVRDMARATFPEHAALTQVQLFQRVTADFWRDLLATYEGNNAADVARTNLETVNRTARDQAYAESVGIG